MSDGNAQPSAAVYIDIQDTPNPNALRLVPNRPILGGQSDGSDNKVIDITSIAEAEEKSPLAAILFALNGVQGVLLGRDFITISKEASVDWRVLRPLAIAAIADYLAAGGEVLHKPSSKPSSDSTASDEDDDVVRQIKEILNERIRPAVAQDGGDIAFLRFEDGIVWLKMKGSCAGCPSSTATLKAGVEQMMRHYVPEVREVRQEI